MMMTAIAAVGFENQSTGAMPTDAEQLVHDAEVAIEHQAEDRGIGDFADHDRGEEGEAEKPARPEQRRVQEHREHRGQRDHHRHLDDQDQRVCS